MPSLLTRYVHCVRACVQFQTLDLCVFVLGCVRASQPTLTNWPATRLLAARTHAHARTRERESQICSEERS